ncbi:hydroxyproline dehydrogenase, partial [Melopsittacus undulatus]|uniref:hydroxyproline dehydrogenase n=1 Tax=Melopsittacus undulatus TaxID=13146 RepID=UPI00146AB4A3
LLGGEGLRGRRARELLRALLVLGLCARPALVRGAGRLLPLAPPPLRAAVYAQFVAGPDRACALQTAARLRTEGLRAALALPCESPGGRGQQGESWFDANHGAALECVGLAAATGPGAMMQLKVTAMMDAELCATIQQRMQEPGTEVTPELFIEAMGGKVAPSLPFLTPQQNQHLGASLRRLDSVAQAAVAQGVTLMVDAEQTHLQGALRVMTLALIGRHNRGAEPRVWSTVQAYVRGAEQMLTMEASWARRYGAGYGVKLVRGAYLEEERIRAQRLGVPDPLHPTLEATHLSYGACLELALALVVQDRVRLMVATHNEASVMQAVQRMEALGIPRRGGVCFGQLYGMCDHVTLALGGSGFSAFKSVPVGPEGAVLPYLLRRAQEHRQGALLRTAAERAILLAELGRRVRKPPPPPRTPSRSTSSRS